MKSDALQFGQQHLENSLRLFGWHQPLADGETVNPRKHIIMQLAVLGPPSCQHTCLRVIKQLEIHSLDALGILSITLGEGGTAGQRFQIRHASKSPVVSRIGVSIGPLYVVSVKPHGAAAMVID